MAERRMFTQKIVDSDAFLEMPLSTQALYFHLNMRADDDGFLNNPKKIQRIVGASDDDLKLLIAKRFVLGFESGVVVIKHWRMHNLLRKDRYQPTQYQEEFSRLKLKKNSAYTEACDYLTTEWQPSDTQMTTQYSIGKDSIVKINNNNNNMVIADDRDNVKLTPSVLADEFNEVWKEYPRKQGKQNALKAYNKARKDGATQEEILQGIYAYRQYILERGIEDQYIKQGSTWFNQRCWMDDYTVTPSVKSTDITRALERQNQIIEDMEGWSQDE